MGNSQNNPMYKPQAPTDVFIDVLWKHPFLVGGAWFSVFAILFVLSWALGIVPPFETDTEDASRDVSVATETVQAEENDTPVHIIIDAIGVDTRINNPKSTSIETLDAALLSGVVHYPGSGNLSDYSNMFLFGHSTGFRVVQNQSFKAFNNLKDLKSNDLIRVRSESREYVYRVTSVTLTKAGEAFVELSTREKKLTLSTCNSFGSKEDRYVVEADFVGDYPIEEGLDL